MSAKTAPPRKTICFRRGGSSILILNFCLGNNPISCQVEWENGLDEHTLSRDGSPFSTLVRYSCFISFSSRLGRPGYILDPPERTICLYSSERTSTAAVWIVWKSISNHTSKRLVWFALSKRVSVTHLLHQVVRHLLGVVGTYILELQNVPSQLW